MKKNFLQLALIVVSAFGLGSDSFADDYKIWGPEHKQDQWPQYAPAKTEAVKRLTPDVVETVPLERLVPTVEIIFGTNSPVTSEAQTVKNKAEEKLGEKMLISVSFNRTQLANVLERIRTRGFDRSSDLYDFIATKVEDPRKILSDLLAKEAREQAALQKTRNQIEELQKKLR